MLIQLLLACSTPAPAPPVAAPAPKPDDHSGHGSGGGHMAEMAATRDRLRADLGPAYDQPVPGLDQADAAKGATLYGQHCAACHGATGRGDGEAGKVLTPPASDFTDAFHARYYSDAGRVRIIEGGSPGTAMAGFASQLDSAQILEVYAHVRLFRGEIKAPAAGHDAEHGHDHTSGHEH